MPGPEKLRMWFENLHVTRGGAGKDRFPLSSLSDGNHVHGGLRIEIGDRRVPHLGYWHDEDVCFGAWLRELEGVAIAFEQPNARYVYDEGEQGQPAFVFERAGDRGFFSMEASQISDGPSDPEWQRVEFATKDFLAEWANLRESFLSTLRREAPATAEAWIRAHRMI